MTKDKIQKNRVTTYLDRDVLMWLKVRALELRVGYQTLMNRTLREAIEHDAASRLEVSQAVSRKEIEVLAASVRRLERQLRSVSVGAGKGQSRPVRKKTTSRKPRSRPTKG